MYRASRFFPSGRPGNSPKKATGNGVPAGTSSQRGGGLRLSASTKRSLIAALVIVALFILISSTASIWINWWWFGSIGFRDVLTTRYLTWVGFFVAGFLLGGGLLLLNLSIALRRSRNRRQGSDLPQIAERLFVGLILGGSVFFGLLTGVAVASTWEMWLLALNGGSFGVDDPIFGRDAGFFIFRLPAINELHGLLLTILIVSLIGVVVTYVIRLGVDPRRYRQFPDLVGSHVAALVAVLLLLVAARYWLNNYELAYSTRGAVFGTGYTDDNIQRIANIALAVVTVAAALLVLIAVRRFRFRPFLFVGGAWLVVQLLLGLGVPALVQRTFVEPNELRRESPYIENNIAMTRASFGIEDVEQRDLSGQAQLTTQDLQSQPTTIDNIRLWDYRYALETFQQLQSLERFYVFDDVDVDRYMVDGELVQVLVSARELDVTGLPDNAQTWTNRHLSYTHGYGVVISPVSEVDSSGRPVFLVGGLGELSDSPIPIDRPEIYFGELDAEWVIVGTNADEYTEPSAPSLEYEGEASGSIALSNVFSRMISALYLGDRNVFISGEINDESRLLIRRGVIERVNEIAPFLTYDDDPYLVIADGRLVWVVDAFTSSDLWPHATPTRGVNYVRNSVKVTIDAYDGTVTYYRTSVEDPIADAYGDIYDGLFTPISEAPATISDHFRYPELLFAVQSEVMRAHHVTDPQVFFEGNDEWAIPQGEGDASGVLEPYFVAMALPNEASAEFTLIRPFIPGGRQSRQNMAAWMAGRTDATGANELYVYRFPRDTTVFGPQQIAAQIDQDTDISPELTLLSQGGSEVLRGNLLVIPINETILYVQPLYIRASNSPGAFPELGKVIVASSENIVMRDTLDEALSALIIGEPTIEGDTTTAPTEPDGDVAPISDEQRQLASEAFDTYQRAEAALAAGDWTTYGEELDELETLLAELAEEPVDETSEPSLATPAASVPADD